MQAAFRFFGDSVMMPVKRKSVNKAASASKFRRQSRRTKAPNIAPMPQRGGFRL